FFRALAITMTVALFSSLVLALLWTPTLSQFFIRKKSVLEKPSGVEVSAADGVSAGRIVHEEAPTSGFFGRTVHFYERIMQRVLQQPVILVASSFVVIVLSVVCYHFLGSDLLPEMDEGGFILDYYTPPGSSLAESDKILQNIEKILRSTPEVENTSRRTGLQLGLIAVTEANRGDFTVRLKQDRSRDIEEIMDDVRQQVEKSQPGTQVEFIQVLQDMIGDLTSAPEPIVIKLFSQDAQQLNSVAPRVADAIQKVPGVVDVLDGIQNTISGPAVTFKVDPITAARSGFTPEEVSTDATAILEGAEA